MNREKKRGQINTGSRANLLWKREYQWDIRKRNLVN